MNYYFFVSSLPSLSLQEPPPLSLEGFLELCAEHLTESDLRAMLALVNNRPEESDNRFVARWNSRETMLRNAIAKIRAARLKKDPSTHLREQPEYDSYVEKAAADAFARGTPAERELAIDRFRWQQIDELEGFAFASGSTVLGYGLKLRMVEKWTNVDTEKGNARATELVARKPEDKKPASADQHTE